MRRRLLVGSLALLILVSGLGLATGARLGPELLAAKDILSGDLGRLDAGDLAEARSHLERATTVLDGWSAAPLRFVPFAGANLDAIEGVLDPLVALLGTAKELEAEMKELGAEGLLEGSRVRIEALSALAAPLREQADSLSETAAAAGGARSGWLLPAVWTELDSLARRSADLAAGLERGAGLLDRIDFLLGTGTPQRYLILLLNNSELRGAGGVLSGIGTLRAVDGRLRLGRFDPQEALRRDPPVTVPSPPGFERYEAYRANTSLWINTSFSPDVPDVAAVAASLYRRVRGLATDGAIVVDPRGLAALLDPSTTLAVPGTDITVTAADLPAFVYSDAYEMFKGQRARRRAILHMGRAAFESALEAGLSGDDRISAIGDAVAGGHLRFVSFDPDVQKLLDEVGVSGALDPPERDVLLVASQNFGGGKRGLGSKLDFWAVRDLQHRCSIQEDGSATCATAVRFGNEVPEGLTRYVAGFPYGVLRSYVEVFIPGDASVTSVGVDGDAAQYRPVAGDGLMSIGVYIEVEPGKSSGITVGYRLPASEHAYSLALLPQPLARDAQVSVDLRYPDGLRAEGPGRAEAGRLHYAGPLTERALIELGDDERSGLPALWQRLLRFWREPLF